MLSLFLLRNVAAPEIQYSVSWETDGVQYRRVEKRFQYCGGGILRGLVYDTVMLYTVLGRMHVKGSLGNEEQRYV